MNKLAPKSVFSMRLDWNLDTETIFGLFSDSPWAILLDSANADHIDAKFDVICASPIATLVSTENSTQITKTPNREPLYSLTSDQLSPSHYIEQYTEDPFSLLKQTLAEFFPIIKGSPLPFSGGAMGCFSYDLGRNIEKLPVIAKDDISLPIMNVGVYDWALVFDYQLQAWTLVHYQSQQELETTKVSLDALLATLAPIHSTLLVPEAQETRDIKVSCASKKPFRLTSQWHNQTNAAAYSDKFGQIQQFLNDGDCYQINLTQRFSSQYEGDEWQAYLALRESNAAPFSAFIRLPQHAVLSISPERFVSLLVDQIQTKPIKGTMPRDSDPRVDKQMASLLATSEKDRAENLMIVDLLRNDIGKVATAGSVNVPKLFDIESFPAVHHLVSTITATLKPTLDATDLLKACFPGGSITGAPKIRAMAIIEELEPSRRSLYCGSIGYISQNGNMDSSITIRTLVAQQHNEPQDLKQSNVIYCWAGGGIVADSKVDAEYQETFDKVSKILPVLSRVNQEV
ncbi:aminodeoxychorismate synthase component I [Shewanella sp. KX20019]|uniref:aminodeoxychorismate synthase component I n=1 Tax=Shewanella sp. KX20019 TaxID=2803864 RepID=UPI00192611D8|nr:aminodeoxychorismate synthase component I [Shewanella sp. KX20019]QQX82327.1 aminodeoxychorismate synthase component I [Shewanella sp. KX20019]